MPDNWKEVQYVDYLNFPVYDVIIERTNNEE